METWKTLVKDQLKTDLPRIQPGDSVDVHYRVVEGDKERVQIFSGTVIKLRGSDMGASFTVRKIASGGVGVERIFPTHSPYISQVIVKRHGFVRRSKLYYMRELKGKAARLREKT